MSTDLVAAAEPPHAWFGRCQALVDIWLASYTNKETRYGYRGDLALWLGWCVENDVYPLAARPLHVEGWLAALDKRGDSGGTAARRHAALSAWYEWLLDNEHPEVTRNPARRIGRAKKPKRRPPGTFGTALSKQRAEALQAAADALSPRASAIIAVMLFCGPRSEEVRTLRDEIGEHDGLPTLTFHGKGGKIRRVSVRPAALARIRRWQAWRDAQGHNGRQLALRGGGQPMFVTRTGRPLAESAIGHLVRVLGKRIGVPSLAPHDLRRTHITLTLANGADLGIVAREVGHVSVATTDGYRRNVDHLAEDRAPGWFMDLNVPLPTEET